MFTKFFIILTFFTTILSHAQMNSFFTDSALRIDLILAGNNKETHIYIHQLKKEKYWSGNANSLIDSFNFGHYYLHVYDSLTDRLIYARGFSSLFNEWQTTAEAKELNKSFTHSLILPFPKQTIKIVVLGRDSSNHFQLKFTSFINPAKQDSWFIKNTPINYQTKAIHYSGHYSKKLDIAFVAEGYTAKQQKHFFNDVKKLSRELLQMSPFKDYATSLNIWAVAAISNDEGVTYPEINSWKNTAIETSFSTFGLERYIMAENTIKLYDAASLVPYDHIVILANSPFYGGGGIYNYYSCLTAKNSFTPIVLIHELGHSIAGLADEYYTSEVAYQNFYNKKIEPWEPNITTLVNFSAKWQHMVDTATAIPTPLTPDNIIIGAFEGAGYSEKDIFRPYPDCRMYSNSAQTFCPVCNEVLIKMFLFFTKE
jgi:hypothetical protein